MSSQKCVVLAASLLRLLLRPPRAALILLFKSCQLRDADQALKKSRDDAMSIVFFLLNRALKLLLARMLQSKYLVCSIAERALKHHFDRVVISGFEMQSIIIYLHSLNGF